MWEIRRGRSRKEKGKPLLFDADLIRVKEHRRGSSIGPRTLRARLRSDSFLAGPAGYCGQRLLVNGVAVFGQKWPRPGTHHVQSWARLAVQEDCEETAATTDLEV